MTQIAFLFPGQGSQAVGMCQDLYDEYQVVRDVFELAEAVTGIRIRELCFNGPIETLTETKNLQPALTAVKIACLKALEKEFKAAAKICAGHSLGEYAALYYSGAISKEDALGLTQRRGELMQREAERQPGKMSAVLKLPIETVQEIVDEIGSKGVLSIANHNSLNQIVITGSPDTIKAASKKVRACKGLCVPLNVSGAWHSPLIEGAQAEFKKILEKVTFLQPKIPVIFNVTADAQSDPVEIRSIMARQFCSPVRWHETIIKMANMGVDTFVEIGPGTVLTGLLKKNLPPDMPIRFYAVNSIETLGTFLSQEA